MSSDIIDFAALKNQRQRKDKDDGDWIGRLIRSTSTAQELERWLADGGYSRQRTLAAPQSVQRYNTEESLSRPNLRLIRGGLS